MDARLISVIIPTYNAGRFISTALDSVMAQDYRPIEVVVVDDGSTDGTAAIVKSYAQVRYIYQANQGPAAARNAGLANSTGELIAFLDADDYWTPHKLTIQSQYLAEHPELGCVIARWQDFLDGGIERPDWIPESALEKGEGTLGMQVSLVHRWVFDRIGPLNERYRYGDDLEWFVRVRESGILIGLMPSILLYRRVHASNLSQNQRAAATARIHILKEHMDRTRRKAAESGAGA